MYPNDILDTTSNNGLCRFKLLTQKLLIKDKSKKLIDNLVYIANQQQAKQKTKQKAKQKAKQKSKQQKFKIITAKQLTNRNLKLKKKNLVKKYQTV